MEGLEILTTPVILLAVGFIVILLSRLAKISPVIGFLIAGIALGPQGFEVIVESKTTHLLAELGVMFLLFDIGLHFSTKSAWSLRKDLLGLAPLQMLLGGLVLGTSAAFIFGLSYDLALLVGLTLALSSTAVVMQILADNKQTESPVGQSGKAVLIFQDVAAIFLLIFADAIGGEGSLGMTVLTALGMSILAFAAVVALGQYVLTPLMKAMTKYDDPEMFTMLGLLIVMMTGLATGMIGLSLTLGAFLAGMVLAETPFRILLQTELRPFRSLLMAFFFITIGMMINPITIYNELGTVISLAVLILSVKAALIGALAFVMRRKPLHLVKLAFLLAQGSEFAFVIFSMASVQSVIGGGLAELLITSVALTMLATPFITQVANKWAIKNFCKMDGTIANCAGTYTSTVVEHPVFILGMNEVGKTLARAFKAHNIPYIAVDFDRKRFLDAIAGGYIVAYGHPGDMRFWNTLGVGKASAFCAAVAIYDLAHEVSPMVQKLWPNLVRYVAVSDSAEAVRFAALGLKPFNNRGAPPGLEMACHLLAEFGIKEDAIISWTEEEQAEWLKANGPVLAIIQEEDGQQAQQKVA